MTAREETFPPDPGSIKKARIFVREALAADMDPVDIVLATSELATNVVHHARTDFKIRVWSNRDTVRLEVSDGSSVLPAVEDLTDSQHGLRLIQAITQGWGVEQNPNGKTIWAEFSTRPTATG